MDANRQSVGSRRGLSLRRGRFRMAAAVGAWLMLVVCAQAGRVVIDDFTDPASGSQHTSPGKPEWTDSPAKGVGGGVRDGLCRSLAASGNTKAQIAEGRLAVTTNSKASPGIFLAYDATVGWGTDPETDPFNGNITPPLDLTGGGTNDRFSLDFDYAFDGRKKGAFFHDLWLMIVDRGVTYVLNIGANGTGRANVWMADNYSSLNAGQARRMEILFAEFAGGPAFESVEAIELHVSSTLTGSEFSITDFQAIPEPVTLMLLASGTGLLRRRTARVTRVRTRLR